ncbi:MAG: V-ATPase V1 sector subunit E [Gomphillus americanus]|uniref:V-ATPase V1 sector subunit E n=1 Tax=Gomphillus americanus TaxID=1940652 RepID=A0A8H3FXX3_9LECA|nr:MAG: V-ATPase V1 sector subunit E [Gomphillus americanus]
MSDDQVAGELKKMTMFIRQEAMEKAKEIQIKADEEFAIEKSKLVREETASIDTEYEKKFKQASMSQQITRSTLANKTRLRVLSARQELLDSLFEKANDKLSETTKNKSEYEKVLKNLILEGLYALNEDRVLIRARKADKDVAEKAMDAATAEYKKNMDEETELRLDEKNSLPQDLAGGVVIVGGMGKIEINNTFEERLRLLETDALPMVRERLFGKNQNRKFYD